MDGGAAGGGADADGAWWSSPQGVALVAGRAALRLGTAAAVLAGCSVAAVILLQRKILYFPQTATVPPPPARLKAPYNQIEDVEVTCEDGVRIKLWHWVAPTAEELRATRGTFVSERNAAARRRTTLLMFHGNAGSRMDRAQWLYQLRLLLGVGVAMVDYRGYGGSQGEPTEEGLKRDARAALRWLRETKSPDGLVLVGESIGTCVALALAAEEEEQDGAGAFDAIVLNAALTSITEVAAHTFPIMRPFLKSCLWDRWDSLGRIHKVTAPLLFLHGPRDNIVPIELGRKLHAAANEPKTWVEIPRGDHNSLPFMGGELYYGAIDTLLADHVDRPSISS